MVDELMRVHGDDIFGFCLRLVGARWLADDLVQQVFMEAYRDLGGFEGRSSLRTWLFSIARNRSLDALKSNQRRLQLIESNESAMCEFEDPGQDLFEHVNQLQMTAALETCLQRLSPGVRATVLMRFQKGATYEELAEVLEASADALQVRVARALRTLRQCLERKGWSGE